MHMGVKATGMKAEVRRTWPSSERASEWRGPGNSLAPFLEISPVKLVDILPNPSLITELAKKSDMIFISSQGDCGGNDFECKLLKDDRFSPLMTWAGRSKIVDMVLICEV
jgi:hypothetical protein